MKSNNDNYIKKIINFLLNILIFIFGIILLISIYTSIQTKILKKDYADFFGYSVFEVQTGSMADAINAGDWIVVKATNHIKLNDIITYNSNGEYITHRVIESYKSTYVTKGDANNSKDEPINKDQVVGKVVKKLGSFGILRKTLFNPSVLLCLIVTIYLFNFAFSKKDKKAGKTKNSKLELNVDKITQRIKEIVKNVKLKIDKLKSSNKKIKNISIKNKNIQKSDKKYDFSDFDYYDDNVDDEFGKTSIYKVIPVDVSEIDDTFLEIAQNELINSDKNQKSEPIKISLSEEKEEPKEPVTKINLELLESQKNGRKSKNLIDKVILIKIEELTELMNIFDTDGKSYVNEPTIKNTFMSTYIDAKYYNYYGEKEYTNKKTSLKIENLIRDTADMMIKEYKGSDKKYSDKVKTFCEIFVLISNLEQANESITDLKAKSEFYKKEIMKYSKNNNLNAQLIKKIAEEIMKIQRNYVGILDYFIRKLETNMFDLKFNKLVTKKEMYGLELEHNISFSKVYSDYIIDKTYNEGVIAENKMTVLLTLLSIKLINDMLHGDFDKKYILYIPHSLYEKEKKFEKLLKMIDDEYARDVISILVTFDDFLDNIAIIKKVKKMGYSFSIVFEKETIILEKDYKNLYIADYIFVNKKIINVVKMLSTIPEELLDKVVYEEIVDKVGDFGGE